MNYVVEPFDLPKVKPQHVPGVFGEITCVVGARIEELAARDNPLNREKIAFFRHLLDTIDARAYADIQRKFLERARSAPQADLPKYLDPVVWFESKVAIALRLRLNERAPMRILDLGTGPGHFPVVARFYGHAVVGTDLPQRSRGVADTDHLYDALCEFHRLERIGKMIQPFGDLDGMGSGYGLVTALLAAFNVRPDKSPWDWPEWEHFLRLLAAGVLAPGGELFMSLADGKLTPEVWEQLAARASWSTDTNRQIDFGDLSACLRASA